MVRGQDSWYHTAGVVLMSAVAAAGFAVAIYAAWLFHGLPDAAQLVDYRPVTSARVYAADGTLIGEYGQIRRIYVPYDRMPVHLRQAFLAAEDRNFFKHSGVDAAGFSRAMAKNLLNFIRGRRLEGGSTITQQVAKNVLLTRDRTVGRKLKELIMARRLESSLAKEQILELYLNDIFLGFRSYGVGAAAYNYFGKSVDQLTLAEMAFLATLPKGPNNYNPITRKKKAIERRNWVLSEMAQAKFITREEAQAAMKEDLVVQEKPQRAKYHDADYFVTEVEQRAKALFKDDIYAEGYYIKTTLDPRLQSLALDSLMNGLERYDRRHGWRGSPLNVPTESRWISQVGRMPIPSERRKWRYALVTSASKGSVSLEVSDGHKGTLVGEDVSWALAGKGLKAGDIIHVEATTEGHYRLKQVPNVNGAMVVIDPYSGRVLAMVGGYSFSLNKFNRATQAKRQPGSSIKPFVYATALEKDFTPASMIDDAPISFMGGDGKEWKPKNYENDFMGSQPMRRGIELSRNLMTVRLADAVGIRTVTKRIVDYGVVDTMPPELSAVLGSIEVTPYELTNAYSLFLNGGRKVTPHLIDEVQDRDGKVIYRADTRACTSCNAPFDGLESPRLQPLGDQVMDPITAYQVNSFMQGVVQRGTARAALSLNRPVGGKTGTTNDYRSAWFVGFTSDLVIGVYIGYDDNRTLGDKETGSVAALPVFIDFVDRSYMGKPVKDFRKPQDAVFLMIHGHEEAFKPGTEPKYEASSGSGSIDGPRPYDEAWKDEAPPAADPPDEKPPAQQKTLDDAATLY